MGGAVDAASEREPVPDFLDRIGIERIDEPSLGIAQAQVQVRELGVAGEPDLAENVARLDLSGWVDEARVEAGNADAIAGIVLHKRRGKGKFLDQYVTMTVRDLLALGWGVTDGPR